MKALHMVTFTLLVIGGLNWLASVFGFELGADLLGGTDTTLAKTVYVLVGLSAVYEAVMHGKHCKECKTGDTGMGQKMPGQM